MKISRAHRSFVAALVAATLLVAACGSDGDEEASTDAGDSTDAQESPDETADAATDTTAADEAPATSGHPIVSFAAHGPGDPNTFGPVCAMGIETTSSNLFRVTAPSTWLQRGSTGGSGDSDIDFEVGDAEVVVTMAETDRQTEAIGIDFGAEVGEADLAGTSVPIVEATIDEATAYAIRDVVYLSGLPEQFSGEAAMTIVVASTDPAAPTLDDATAVLSSIRAERCAVIADALVAMSSDGVLAVPEFDDDPLGKTYPGGDQPAFDMAAAVELWSVDQLAYLLPFPEPIDACVAESLKDELPSDFPLGFSVITAVEGTQQDALTAIADAC